MWITPDRLFVLSILIPLDCVIEIRLYDRVNQDSIMWSGKSRFDYTSDIVVRLYVLSIDSRLHDRNSLSYTITVEQPESYHRDTGT